MLRFSLNQLKSSFELGSTSNWVVSFEKGGASAPDISNFNIIAGQWCPVLDVSYDDYNVYNETISVGPSVTMQIPAKASNSPDVIALTLYDDHALRIRLALNSWVDLMQIKLGRAPMLKELKKYSLIVKIHSFTKDGLPVLTDAFYILPSESLARRGDQSFSADTLPISFNVIGRQ